MSKDLDQIIEKAQSEAQKDVIKQFFQKNAKIITISSIAIIIVIVSIITTTIIKSQRQVHYSKILHQAHKLQSLHDIKETKKLLEEIVNSSNAPSYIKSLAGFRYAGILIDENKNKEAFAIYLDIAKCRNCRDFSRELASLLAIKLWSADKKLQQDDKLKQLTKLAKNANYLNNHINEQLAIIERNRGNINKSYEIFQDIANDDKAIKSLKVRAQTYLTDLHQEINTKNAK